MQMKCPRKDTPGNESEINVGMELILFYVQDSWIYGYEINFEITLQP
jgi:hypothetical protein